MVVAACGSAERHDATTPDETAAGCPSDTAPERCRDLADAATRAGNGQLAWAYTVLECQSHGASQCTVMWQRYAKLAPTQTDALNVLHSACDHLPAACEQLAAWHLQRGHALAAAAYQKRVDAARRSPSDVSAAPRGANAIALATDLGAVMHVSAAPRTDTISQMVGHALHAPMIQNQPERKAWSMHAAALITSADACASMGQLDRDRVPLEKCVSEVRPYDGNQIAIRNRCNTAINVAYAGARGNRATVANRFRLDRYEAHSLDISHADVGPLTFAVCGDGCRATTSSGDASSAWAGQDTIYYCTKSSLP